MRAIVLAAGEGRRLRPATDGIPKCLVPFRGRPLLDRALESLRAAGVGEIALVTGYRAEALAPYGLPTRRNPEYASTQMVRSLFAAEDLMEGGILVVYGDIAFAPRLVRAALDAPAPLAVVVDRAWRPLWRARGLSPLEDAETLRLDGDRIVALGGTPASEEEIDGRYVGLVKIAPPALDRVRAFYRAREAECRTVQMTPFLQALIDAGVDVRAALVEGGWLEIDSLDDLAAYERSGFDAR